MDVEQVIAELRRLADELCERSRPRPAADPLAGVARAALAQEVSSVIRHDMRNKLGSIRNASFYLKRRVQQTDLWQADPRTSQFFELIEETIVDATMMLDDPLGARLSLPRQPVRASARACVDLAVAGVEVPERVRLRVDAGPGVVAADRDEIALALRCLLENAVEASADGGVVEVEAREDGDSLVVTVRDVGAGIPAGSFDSIFKAFFTTKEGHAGIGLNIARRIARRSGGDVGVAPASRGTVAMLAVPLAEGGDRGGLHAVGPSAPPDPEDAGPSTGVRSQGGAGPR